MRTVRMLPVLAMAALVAACSGGNEAETDMSADTMGAGGMMSDTMSGGTMAPMPAPMDTGMSGGMMGDSAGMMHDTTMMDTGTATGTMP